jgi:hypothetical protein
MTFNDPWKGRSGLYYWTDIPLLMIEINLGTAAVLAWLDLGSSVPGSLGTVMASVFYWGVYILPVAWFLRVGGMFKDAWYPRLWTWLDYLVLLAPLALWSFALYVDHL